MDRNGLSELQLQIILRILAPFAGQIEQVGLFGSRATGRYRENSDIDMVLYGTLDEKTIDRIYTLLNESALSINVDLKSYRHITHNRFKAHIDEAMRPLFSHQQLCNYHQ